MGIKGLIPLLKPIQKDIHISEYAGQPVAVDGHCWLHRGAFGCASELARGAPTQTYVAYFMNLVNLLLFNKVIPIIVFDGQRLPIKNVTNEARSKHRDEKLAQGNALYKQGKLADADKCFQQAIHITPIMVFNIIKELDKINVQHIIAPYEADPQLAYLISTGQVKAIITEDSDLLAFGAEKVVVKMDRYGEGHQVIHQDMFRPMALPSFNLETFRYACILSGCDYLPSLPGIGLKKALDIVSKHQTVHGIMSSLLCLFSRKTVDEYQEKFMKANAAFMYQFVFDPTSRTYIRLNALPKEIKVDHLVGLGESPQNRAIPLLCSNKAMRIDKATIQKDANKENIDPFADLEESEFSELEFDETMLKDVESLLGTVDPVASVVPPVVVDVKKKDTPSIEEVMTRAFLEVLDGAEKKIQPRPAKKTFTVYRDPTSPPLLPSSSSSSPSPLSLLPATDTPPSSSHLSAAVTGTSKPHALGPSTVVAAIPGVPSSSLGPVASVPAAAVAVSTAVSAVTDATSGSPVATAIQARPASKKPSPFDKFKRLSSGPLNQAKRPFVRYPPLDPFKGIKPFQLPVVDISQYPDPFAKVKVPFTMGRPDSKRKNSFPSEGNNKARRL